MAEAAARISRLGTLSRWQWRVLLTAPFVLLGTWLRLRLRGYRATLADAGLVRPSGLGADEELALARDTAFAFAVAVRYGPGRPRCLLRSLALARLLGRKGIACELRIGVPAGRPVFAANGRIDFSAHAWIECRGVVLNDREDVAAQFIPLETGSGRP